MKKPFVVSVSVSFLVLLAGYFFHQEITSRNLPKPDHIKIVSVPDGFILDEEQPIKEVGALRAELEQLKEEFKLIRINSGRMVEQVNALTQVVHELKKSYKVSENTTKPNTTIPKKGFIPPEESEKKPQRFVIEEPQNTEELVTKSKAEKPKFKNGYVPYRETNSEVMLHMLNAQILDNTLELEKMNRNLDDIEFQVGMDSMRRDYNYRREHPYNYLKLPGTIGNQCDY